MTVHKFVSLVLPTTNVQPIIDPLDGKGDKQDSTASLTSCSRYGGILKFFQICFHKLWHSKYHVMLPVIWYYSDSFIHSIRYHHKSPVKRICVFEHSVITNFNCACPAIQRGQGSGFLSEGSSWLTACMSEQRRFWRDCADVQARLNLRCSHRR